MRHLILVKLKKETPDAARFAREIEPLFLRTLEIDGVHQVKVTPACITAANRNDVLIELELTPEGLRCFDASDIHAQWKQRYSSLLESKTVFDGE